MGEWVIPAGKAFTISANPTAEPSAENFACVFNLSKLVQKRQIHACRRCPSSEPHIGNGEAEFNLSHKVPESKMCVLLPNMLDASEGRPAPPDHLGV